MMNQKGQMCIESAVMIALLMVSSALAAQEMRASRVLESQSSAIAAKIETAPPPSDFVIGAEDILAINVWKEPDLSREVPVRSDGKITLPLIGDVVASGKTTAQLQAELEKELKKFLEAPAVTVVVRQIRSRSFNVLGEVVRPGRYPLGRPTTVLDAIAVAGGFRARAKVKSIYVLRREPDGSPQRISFNYKKAIQGRDSTSDFELRSRDTIVIP